MTDPTEMVLTGVFATALGVFGLSSLSRAAFRGKCPPATPDPSADGSPYQEPGEIPAPPELPVGKVPVWFYRSFDLAGAALVFLVFSALVLSAPKSPDPAASLNPSVLLFNIGFLFAMAGIVTVLVTRRVGLTEWLGLRWPQWPWVILLAPGSVLFMWTMFFGLQKSGYMTWMKSLGVETVQDTVKLLQKSQDPLILGLMTFAAVIAAPICEEIIFRGFFYPVMKKFAGAWPAAVCSALVFAGAHGNLTSLLPLFLFAGLLVFLYEKTGSLWAPIAVHFCFNGATVIVEMAARYYHIPLEGMQ